jgi:LysR family glycine cleavage system transcriptional activator
LRRFALLEPTLNLHVIRSLNAIDSDQSVGPSNFEQLDLQPEDSMVVIRFGTGAYPGFHVERMFGSDYIAVCSPKLLESGAPLKVPADMRHQVLLHDDALASEHAGPSWEEWFRLAGVRGVDSSCGPHFGDSGMVYVAALDGLGVALASKPLVATAMAQGRLVAPFKIAVGQNFAYYLVIPEVITARPEVMAFQRWLLEEAKSEGLCRPN